jgi:hypothetical protein
VALKDPSLEVVLPDAAELSELPDALLQPQALPGLWSEDSLTVQALRAYFAGGHVVQVPRQRTRSHSRSRERPPGPLRPQAAGPSRLASCA